MNDKKIQILASAVRLFTQEGLSVPTAKIAKGAKVSNGTLFNYFATKQDLIDGVYLYIKERMSHAIMGEIRFDSGIKHMLLDIWMAYISWAQAHPLEHQVVDLLYSSQMLSEDIKETGEHFFIAIHDVVQKEIDNKTLIDAPRQYLCDIAVAHLQATMLYAQNNNLKGSALSELTHKSFEIYWNGIKQTKP